MEKVQLKTDLYTKFVLTVIALALIALLIEPVLGLPSRTVKVKLPKSVSVSLPDDVSADVNLSAVGGTLINPGARQSTILWVKGIPVEVVD